MEQILKARDHYQVLGLARDCDEKDIKKSHRSDSEMKRTERAFRAVQVAYETLSLPHKRKAYDLQLKMQGKSAQFVPGESSHSGEDLDAEDGPTTVQVLRRYHADQNANLRLKGFGCGYFTSAIWVALGYTLNNVIHHLAYQTSFASAFMSGVMAGLTILLGHLMPNMSFGSNSIYAGGAIAFVGVYYCSVDVFGAIFVGILAWHFLQGLPTVCLGTLVMVLLYIVYRYAAVSA
eukprot:747445-Hanusia_phi.AAC.3